MKTFKIINHQTGDYTVKVNHLNSQDNTSHDFDNHAALVNFTDGLKSNGYAAVNDLY